ncbi:MAG: hypothetical protein LBG98_01995 [Puniceicoccales bacterium]|jgi:hypothetical protein|nr:hypothetical protein [Puniceicoccales bacterium]
MISTRKMQMFWRWIKAVVLLPFNVLVVIPVLVLYGTDYHWPSHNVYRAVFGGLLFMAGLFLASWTMWLFVKRGQGTAAPWDPPQKLVVGRALLSCAKSDDQQCFDDVDRRVASVALRIYFHFIYSILGGKYDLFPIF